MKRLLVVLLAIVALFVVKPAFANDDGVGEVCDSSVDAYRMVHHIVAHCEKSDDGIYRWVKFADASDIRRKPNGFTPAPPPANQKAPTLVSVSYGDKTNYKEDKKK